MLPYVPTPVLRLTIAVFSSALLSASSRARSELALLRRDMNDDDLSDPSGRVDTLGQKVTLRRVSSDGANLSGTRGLVESLFGICFELGFVPRSGLWRGLGLGLDLWRRPGLGRGLDLGLFFFFGCSASKGFVYGSGGWPSVSNWSPESFLSLIGTAGVMGLD